MRRTPPAGGIIEAVLAPCVFRQRLRRTLATGGGGLIVLRGLRDDLSRMLQLARTSVWAEAPGGSAWICSCNDAGDTPSGAEMPELPEAETIARGLDRGLSGHVLDCVRVTRNDVIHGDPRPLSRLLPGRRVVRVHRRAKRVIVALEPDAELVFHLGMSGRLTMDRTDVPVEKHTHLRIAVRGEGFELRFRDPRRFGGVWCFAGGGRHVGRRLGPLGVEPLDATPACFRRLLSRRRQIKALLLDQRAIAGLGNIYCDEALHAAGVHPLTQADALDAKDAGRLLRAIKSTLNRAIRFNGSTLVDFRGADGEAGSFQKYHRVYQRTGHPCRTCGTPIERMVAAGRSSFFCPCCQPNPKDG